MRSGILVHGTWSSSTGGPAADGLWMLDAENREAIERLRHLAKPLPPPEAGEWLAEHWESGQSFEAYLASDPPIAQGERSVLYVVPLGSFSEVEAAVLQQATEYMGLFFGLPVEVLDSIPMEAAGEAANIPPSAYRSSGRGFGPQFRSEWILQKLLRPKLPRDAAALIGFTAQDLWPGQGWNFVFGQANLKHRVGVWSMARFGDPALSQASRALALRRTLKVATHETGHMLGMRHCTAWSCNMNGSNHLGESDRQPLDLCPVCLAKLAYATDVNLVERGEALKTQLTTLGLKR